MTRAAFAVALAASGMEFRYLTEERDILVGAIANGDTKAAIPDGTRIIGRCAFEGFAELEDWDGAGRLAIGVRAISQEVGSSHIFVVSPVSGAERRLFLRFRCPSAPYLARPHGVFKSMERLGQVNETTWPCRRQGKAQRIR